MAKAALLLITIKTMVDRATRLFNAFIYKYHLSHPNLDERRYLSGEIIGNEVVRNVGVKCDSGNANVRLTQET